MKLSLCLTKYLAVKAFSTYLNAYGGMDVLLQTFLISALDGGEWSTSRSGRFNPEKKVPGSHWTPGWLGQKAGLGAVAKRRNSCLAGNRKSVIYCAMYTYFENAFFLMLVFRVLQ